MGEQTRQARLAVRLVHSPARPRSPIDWPVSVMHKENAHDRRHTPIVPARTSLGFIREEADSVICQIMR